MVNGKQTFHIFSTTDQAEHARMKRPVAKYFSLGHVLALEPHMDTVIGDLIKNLDERFVKSKKTCDLGEWIAFCKPPLSLHILLNLIPNT
jgi:cytochrome P450